MPKQTIPVSKRAVVGRINLKLREDGQVPNSPAEIAPSWIWAACGSMSSCALAIGRLTSLTRRPNFQTYEIRTGSRCRLRGGATAPARAMPAVSLRRAVRVRQRRC